MEKRFVRSIQSLTPIFEYVEEFIIEQNINETFVFPISFLVEEIFTNMVKYNVANQNEILLSLTKKDNNVFIQIADFDVDPFDITKAPEVNPNASVENRKVGGLGIHLVKKLADHLEYEYHDRESRITVIKKLEE